MFSKPSFDSNIISLRPTWVHDINTVHTSEHSLVFLLNPPSSFLLSLSLYLFTIHSRSSFSFILLLCPPQILPSLQYRPMAQQQDSPSCRHIFPASRRCSSSSSFPLPSIGYNCCPALSIEQHLRTPPCCWQRLLPWLLRSLLRPFRSLRSLQSCQSP